MEIELGLLTVFILHQTTAYYLKDWTMPKITWKTGFITAGVHLIVVSQPQGSPVPGEHLKN